MYNEENKTNFIKFYTESQHTSKVATRIFTAIAVHEEEFRKDVSEMTVEELQETLIPVTGLRSRSKWMGIVILKEYMKWCAVQGFCKANDNISKVNLLGLDKLRTQLVASPLHLQKSLDEILDPEEEKTMDNVQRCLLWLAYGGVEEEDILVLKHTDVNLQKMIVNVGKTEYPIYREALPAFHNTVTLLEFSYKHPLYSQVILRKRVEGDLLLRGVKAETDVKTARSSLSKKITSAYKSGQTSQQLSFTRVKLSGIFHKEYELERAGVPTDFSKYVQPLPLGDNPTQDKVSKENRRQIVRSQEYLEDYQRWKLAFSI